MSSEWQSGRLGDFIELKRGYDLPQAKRIPGSVPLISSSGVSDFHSEAMVKGPGVVTGRYGTIGQVYYVDDDFWPLNTTLYIRDFKGNDPKFVGYFLRTIDFFAYSDKAAVPGVNRNHLHEASVALPPLSAQKSIAKFLGALDDRITLLRETNATLEAIAQALFKSWFVDFDPVRAKQEGRAPEGMDEATAALFPDGFEESELGLVPRGWSYVSLRDVVSIFDSKRVPLSGQDRAKRQGPYPYYGAAALMDSVDDYLFDGVFLLTGEDGSVADANGYPITQYVWGKIWVNNHAHVLQGKNGISTEHVMLSLKRTNIQPFITGAVQAKLSQSNLWRIMFLNPQHDVATAFGCILEPLFARIRHNSDQAQTLATLRDTLLPRLISGQLRLPEAAALIEEATA